MVGKQNPIHFSREVVEAAMKLYDTEADNWLPTSLTYRMKDMIQKEQVHPISVALSRCVLT